MRLLVTRPQAEAERTVAQLERRGHEALIAPVLTIEPVADATFDPSQFDAIIMTSGNAARALQDHPALGLALKHPLFAVGGQTAQAARDAGFSNVMSAEGDAADLLALLRGRWVRGGRLLYLAGSDRSRDLAAELATSGITVETVVVYSAMGAARLPDERRTGDPDRNDRRRAALFPSQQPDISRLRGCRRAARLDPNADALLPVAARRGAVFSQTIQAHQGRAASR